MVSGEYNHDAIFLFGGPPDNTTEASTSTELNYLNMSSTLWGVFIIVMPILFTNLLVSITSNYSVMLRN